jgi:tetratricopeptide (TPR) repeat protein
MQDDSGPSAWVPSEDGRAFATVMEAEKAAAAGDSGEAERLFREGIRLYREAGKGVDHALGRYGAFLLKEGRLDDAVAALGEAMEMGTDLGAIWSDYIAIQAQCHDMSRMFDTFDRLPPSVSEYATITDWILPYVGRAVRAGDLEYGELLCRTVRDEAHSRNEMSGAFKAVGQHGQILEKMGRLDEAIDEWQSAFDAGSDDPTTVDRLSLVLDRSKLYDEATAVIRTALERGFRANTEETLRKRLVRLETKIAPGTPKTDVPVFSVRGGNAYASLVMQRRFSPPIRRIAIVGTTAYCLAFKKDDGILTRVDLETGEAKTQGGLPQFDELRVLPSGWGIGLRWVGRLGKGRSSLAFLDPECEVVRTIDLPDVLSQVAYGAGQWYVGCRNGRLYTYNLKGKLLWEWVTPGADPAPDDPYARIYPYFVAATEQFVAVATWGDIYAISLDGASLWELEVPNQGPLTITVPFGGPLSHAGAWTVLEVEPGASDEEVKHAYRRLVLATHPDHHPDEPSAPERFRMVQSAYEELLAADHAEYTQRMITVSMASYRFVRYLGAAADSILVASSDGVLAMLDASGEVRGRRVVGRGDVIPALNPGGTLAAAWCDGVLSFFAGDSIINSIEIDERPGSLVPWGRDLLVVQRASVKVFDPAGRSVWALEFSKGIAGLSINDRYLVCGAGALLVFERSRVSF